jgi:phosphonoacetate hydrolase
MTQARPSRLLVMVWDGMRPDLVSPDLTPNLAALAGAGVVFDANHAVVPTVTRINAATLATGAPSSTHGLPANSFFAPAVDATGPISVGDGENVAQLRAAYGVFGAATIADVVKRAGGNTTIVSSGTRGSSWMLHPCRKEAGDLILHPTLSTSDELAPIVARLGPMPADGAPNTARNEWLARAAAEIILPKQRPDVLLFWHDDPDHSQHKFGFGHPMSMRSIQDADRHLGLLLASLDDAGLRDETLVVVASDHGYVQITQRYDPAPALAALASDARVVLAANGCSALLRLGRPDDRALARLAAEVGKLPGTGVMFSGARGGAVVDGTYPLAAIRMDGPLAPDLLVALSWADDPNEHGHGGVSYGLGGTSLAGHGGASAWEIRNTLIMQGPGLHSGRRSGLPSGTIDIAPTVLTALGLPVPDSMTGRILHEALTASAPDTAPPAVERWDQRSVAGTLSWSSYAGHQYLDAAMR